MPENTYLFVRGHDIFDKVVEPLAEAVCRVLRRQRENEIRRNAVHRTQYNNELLGYQHAATSIEEMLSKHSKYEDAPLYHRIIGNLRQFVEELEKEETAGEE